VPILTDDFVTKTQSAYIELYEKLTGEKFKKAPTENVPERIEKCIKDYLEETST